MNEKSNNIIIAGDILPAFSNFDLFSEGNSLELYGNELLNLFSNARFSIANLEGAITDRTVKQLKTGPVLKVPTSTTLGLKALGLSAVSLANNHATDYNSEGLQDTIKTLSDNGIIPVGYGTLENMRSYVDVEVGGKRVCIYCVSEIFYNEPSKEDMGANVYDEYLVCNELRDLKSQFDYIVVLYHGGAEYFQYATPLVRRRCHRMIDSGADFIFTQHTHCIGCEEYYKDGYILHGQGNFFFAHQKKRPDLTKSGFVVELDFRNDEVLITKHPVVVVNNKVVRYDKDYSFAEFDRRSERNLDEDWVTASYQKEKLEEIGRVYVRACKGSSRYWTYYKRFFPSRYRDALFSSFSRKQIMLITDMLHRTRRNEDMYNVWKYLLQKFE